MNRKLFILTLKYAPVLLTVTASVKIFLRCYYCQEDWSIVNLINVILDSCLLGIIYIQSKEFGFCWKHRSLCRIAGWNYLFYFSFILFNIEKEKIIQISIFNLIFIFIVLLIYEIDWQNCRKHIIDMLNNFFNI